MKIYYINLERSEDRRLSAEEALKSISDDIVRVNAVDFTEPVINNYVYNNKRLIACTLSHLKAIEIFFESKDEYAMICEDDITLEYMKYWRKSINQVVKEAPSDWEILQLSAISTNLKPFKYIYQPRSKGLIYSALAYIINQRGAQKLLLKFKPINSNINLPIPTKNINKPLASTLSKKVVIKQPVDVSPDIILFDSVITYAYFRPFFTYNDNFKSLVRPEHKHLQEKSKVCITAWLDNDLPMWSYNSPFSESLKKILIADIFLCKKKFLHIDPGEGQLTRLIMDLLPDIQLYYWFNSKNIPSDAKHNFEVILKFEHNLYNYSQCINFTNNLDSNFDGIFIFDSSALDTLDFIKSLLHPSGFLIIPEHIYSSKTPPTNLINTLNKTHKSINTKNSSNIIIVHANELP